MRTIPLVDLKAGFQAIKSDIMRAIEGVLEGMNLYIGPNCEAFEREFAAYCGTEYAIGVGSGTEAIHLALLSCGIGQGDEVITSPHTFFATAEAIVQTGARPVFADIDPETFTVDPNEITNKITERTKAIIPVHMYGQMADMGPIMEVAEKHGLTVIEDACQAHGAMYRDKKAGSFGSAGCFSFYFTKNLGGYGEGGIVTTNNPEIAGKVRIYRNHGHRSKYEHAVFGYNGRLDEIQAAILRIRLKYLDEYNVKRREIAQRYRSLLRDTPLNLPNESPARIHVYHLYVVRSQPRDALQEYLTAQGVGTGIHYKIPIHLQEPSRYFGYNTGDFPKCEKVCDEILSIPIYPELDVEVQNYVAEKIRAFYNGRP
jgi:dTDP-4-amino-4,6-dideoxygalactose transaminase